MKDACASAGLTPLDDALKQLLAALTPLQASESVAISQADGRIVAQTITSELNIPPADNSAMDGYALRAEDGRAGNELRLVGQAFAGHPYSAVVQPGECVRIMTGRSAARRSGLCVYAGKCQR